MFGSEPTFLGEDFLIYFSGSVKETFRRLRVGPPPPPHDQDRRHVEHDAHPGRVRHQVDREHPRSVPRFSRLQLAQVLHVKELLGGLGRLPQGPRSAAMSFQPVYLRLFKMCVLKMCLKGKRNFFRLFFCHIIGIEFMR